ncbi:MAG: hypothetical protein F6K07_32305 [Okeania sp. SIO1H5]|uniref:hypothetical protein n=1 Tax=Okeania sp. SIO1H5 TaxID=2607777 RepID=UPI0013BCBCB8|nr:hypothetical protein [Okeania sp. SIO1H5]NET23688.1 hypothetical protein [Okeania sp. SIO1H5]
MLMINTFFINLPAILLGVCQLWARYPRFALVWGSGESHSTKIRLRPAASVQKFADKKKELGQLAKGKVFSLCKKMDGKMFPFFWLWGKLVYWIGMGKVEVQSVILLHIVGIVGIVARVNKNAQILLPSNALIRLNMSKRTDSAGQKLLG